MKRILTDEDIASLDKNKVLTDKDIAELDSKPKKRILWKGLGAEITPGMKQGHPYLSAIAKTGQEAFVAPAHFANMMSLNNLRGLSNEMGIEYPEIKDNPLASNISKGFGVAGLVQSPIIKGIMGAGSLGSSILARTGTGVLKGGAIGLATSPDKAFDMWKRGEQGKFGAAMGGILSAVGAVGSKVRNYTGDKATSIKQGMEEWAKSAWKKYGQRLSKISKTSTESVNPIDTINSIEQNLVRKGIVEAGGKRVRGAVMDKVDKALLKSYEKLTNEYALSSGKIPLKSILTEGRNIRASGGKMNNPTTLTHKAADLHHSINGSVKGQVKNTEFQQMQSEYSKFKQDYDLASKYFQPFQDVRKTGKGEKFLSRITQTKEAREIARVIKQSTGITLKGAKLKSVITGIASTPAGRMALYGGAGALAAYLGLRRFGGGE